MAKRKCSICGVVKELNAENFAVKRQTKTGYDSSCKTCKQAYDRARYAAKKDEISKQKAGYYQKNKENIKKARMEYYYANQGRCRQSQSEWQKSHPVRRRMSCAKSRTNHFGAISTLTEDEWLKVKGAFDNRCAYCGMTEEESLDKYGECLHQEHVIPLAAGGPYSVGNIVPACRSCNSSKANQNFFGWYRASKVYSEHRFQRITDYLDQTKIRS